LITPVEDSAHHILLVLNPRPEGGDTYLGRLSSIVYERISMNKSKRIVFHVISSLGRPFYIEKLKSFIQNNIGLSLTIRFHGVSPDDLEGFLKKSLGRIDSILIERDLLEYRRVLDKHGVEYIVID